MRCGGGFVIYEIWGGDFCKLKRTKIWNWFKEFLLLWNQNIWCTFDSIFRNKVYRAYISDWGRNNQNNICYGKFPFNFKLFRSVLALRVAVVSALSARRLTSLLRFVYVLAVCGGQAVGEWLRMEACILRFNRRRPRRSNLGFFHSYM